MGQYNALWVKWLYWLYAYLQQTCRIPPDLQCGRTAPGLVRRIEPAALFCCPWIVLCIAESCGCWRGMFPAERYKFIQTIIKQITVKRFCFRSALQPLWTWCSELLPVSGLDDFRAGGEAIHDISPAGVRDAIGERRLDELSVVESGVIFETVHAFPVLQRNFDKLGKREDFYKKKMQRSWKT